jgi:membrane-associated protein
MDLKQILDVFLHIKDHLAMVAEQYGPWIYAILFLIIFCETGLVVTPFLPGDSLLFAAGALAAIGKGSFNVHLLVVLLIIAAILGDAVNYSIGKRLGAGIFKPGNKILRPEYLERTHAFYEKYGPKTIVLARFVPIVRTFAPFVAGMGKMTYAKFATYNIVGAVAWVTSMTYAGYIFGRLPFVEKHFEAIVLAIIFISVLPMAFELWKAKQEAKRAGSVPPAA